MCKQLRRLRPNWKNRWIEKSFYVEVEQKIDRLRQCWRVDEDDPCLVEVESVGRR